MKLDEFKKLFKAKRILALALVAAMTVTSLPSTALAAEAETEIETVVETELQTDAATEEAAPSEVEDTEETGEDSVSNDSEEALEVASEEPIESAAEEPTETTTESTETTAEEPTETTTVEPTETESVELTETVPTESTVEKETEEQTTELELDSADEKLTFHLGTDKLKSEDKTAIYDYNRTPFTEGDTLNENIWSRLYLSYGSLEGDIYVDNVWDSIQIQWKQKGTNGYTNMAEGTVPQDAGEYQLELKIPDTSQYNGDTATIEFVIKKATVKAEMTVGAVSAGSKKADVKIVDANIEGSDGTTFTYNAEKPEDGDIVFSDLKVKDAYTGNDAEEPLVKNKDYILEATVAFSATAKTTYGKNYEEPKCNSAKVVVGDLKQTKIEVELTGDTWKDKVDEGIDNNNNPIKEITFGPYTGKEQAVFSSDNSKVKVGETSVSQDGKPVFIELVDAVTKTEWYKASYYSYPETDTDADGNVITTNRYYYKVGDKLEGKPIEAGTYVYRIAYDGDNGLYDKSSVDVLVKIKQAEVSIQPTINGNDTGFYQGVTAEEVLKHVGYQVYDASDSSENPKAMDIDRDRFFTNADWEKRTQPYEPVFEIIRVIQDKDGNVVRTDEGITKLISTLAQQDITDGYKEVFKVRFSGQVAVYTADGNYESSKNVTTENKNYTVKNDYNEKAVEIKINNSTTVVIDTEDIIKSYTDKGYQEVKGIKVNDIDQKVLYKVYDGEPLFQSRGDYKKANVENAKGSLVYTWKHSYSRPDVAELETGYESLESFYYYNNNNAGVNAGVYKLTISYNDETAEKHAEDAVIYFVIERQRAKLVPKAPEGGYKALTDTTVGAFLDECQNTGKVMLYGTDGTWKEAEEKTAPAYYFSSWSVKKEVANPDGTKEYQTVYDPTETFVKDGKYKVAVTEVNFNSSNYTDDDIHTVKVENDKKTLESKSVYEAVDEADITVSVMGTKEYPLKQIGDLGIFTYSGKILEDLEPSKVVEVIKTFNPNIDLDITWSYEYEGYAPFDLEKGPIHAGTYYVFAGFKGSEEYKAFEATPVIAFTINPLDLKVNLKDLGAAVEAGQSVYKIKQADNFNIEGYIEADKEAFTWNGTGFPAFYQLPALAVYDSDGKECTSTLKGGTTYTLRIEDNGELYIVNGDTIYDKAYAVDYRIVLGSEIEFTTLHGRSTVSVYDDNWYSLKLYDEYNNTEYTHKISFREGIPYSYNNDGNYVIINIQKPLEYDYNILDKAAYENEIKEAGGEILSAPNGWIRARFNASDKKDTSFTIRWSEGHQEKFELLFSQADLEADLSQAVAPKSIAFNSPKTKMVVGETQALDVKLTKAQNSDIIWLQYEVISGNEYLAVDKDTGVAQALKAGGSATVTVYPVMRDENGKPKKIESAKPATVKITVSQVAAPKLNKLIPQGNKIEVQYKYVEDHNYDYGYRREIYVVKGRASVSDIEGQIKGMTNQQWKAAGFAVAPIFMTQSEENNRRLWDKNGKKTDVVSYTITGLDSTETYTVYIRNVSKIASFNDGNEKHNVEFSASGIAKEAKTTLPYVINLYAEIADRDIVEVGDETGYRFDLSKESSAVISVKGSFDDLDSAADKADIKWYSLPLESNLKKEYTDPKLTYTVRSGRYVSYYDEESEDYIEYWDYAYAANAKVDKKGKITFKQPERLRVEIRDSLSGRSDYVYIDVIVTPDSIAGKNITMQVGQRIALTDLVTYKAGKTVLTTNMNYARGIVADDELKDALNQQGFELNGGYLRATKEVKSPVSFEVKDRYIDGVSTQVKIKVKALEPVKNLSVTDIADNKFTVQFVANTYAEGYRIDVTDARGSLVGSFYANNRYWWESSKKTYMASAKIQENILTAQSKYNVSVTALFRDQISKTVKKAFTTTKLPASDWDLGLNERNGEYEWYDSEYDEYYPSYRGMPVTTFETYRNNNSQLWIEDDYWGNTYFDEAYDIGHTRFVSGNSYTLLALADNIGAQYAVTDKLIWTSSNSKVASVKAIGGSYSATLKAVRAGTTTIEVKSSITKKVIARYNVTVAPVGNANNSYYGDNEELRYEYE